MKRTWKYAVCTVILFLLVLSAFSMPGVILEWQDAGKLSAARFDSRAGIDYEAINARYLTDREVRLDALVSKLQERTPFYISEVEKQKHLSDQSKGVSVILQQQKENAFFLWELGIAGELEQWLSDACITASEEYLVYSSDTESGVVLQCILMEIQMGTEKICIMADASDYFVYYLEYYGEDVKRLDADYRKGETVTKWTGQSGRLIDLYCEYAKLNREDCGNILISSFLNGKSEYGVCIGFREFKLLSMFDE